jgi:type IV pilus assembly protein PilE
MDRMHQCPPLRQRQSQSGVTLIELMIAVAVVTLLAMVALPSYQDSVRKSRRSEAFNALSAVQQAQERSRGNYPSYCPNLASAPTATICGLGIAETTANQRYTLAFESPAPDANSYTVTATAQGAQATDTRCLKMGVQASAGGIRYGSAASAINWALPDPDVNRCWAK